MREPMVFVVAFLMKPFSTEFANVGPITLMNPHVGVEGGAPVEGFAASPAFVRFVRGVNDLVPAECRSLPKALSANLTNKRPGS